MIVEDLNDYVNIGLDEYVNVNLNDYVQTNLGDYVQTDLSDYVQTDLGAFGGEWETWCEQKYPGDPAMIAKCQSQPFGPLTLAPWTDVGALQRGLPKPQSLLVNLVGGAATPSTSAPMVTNSSEGLFGIPRTAMLAGLGVLAVGVGAMLIAKKKKKKG